MTAGREREEARSEEAPGYRCWHLAQGSEGYGTGRLFTLDVPADLRKVADVRSFVDALELGGRLSDARIFDMKVALSEAVANAIEHAQADVKVWFWMLNDRVVVEIRNPGDFGQDGGKPRTPGRGFGLKLMVSLADEVAFVGARQGNTRVRLTFKNNHSGDGDQFGDGGRHDAGDDAGSHEGVRRGDCRD